MALIVADTDVLIDFLTGREPAGSQVEQALTTGDLRTTAISRFELLSGAKTARQLRMIRRLLAVVGALRLDDAAADQAAAVRRSLERRGRGIGMGDSLIAGIVLATGAVLLTRDRRHFERVEGLELAEPA